jgi:cytidylate kinase
VITIDGPAGAGKSTAARAVALRLGFAYLDSGALYRAVAVAARRAGVAAAAPEAIATLRARTRIEAEARRHEFRVRIDGSEVGEALRAPEVSELASQLATLPAVRDWVGDLLRAAAAGRGCVAEGRDLGSRVFPDARLKVYLTASLETRAQRRGEQLQAAGGPGDTAAVREAIVRRDARDRTRVASPLRVPPGAARVDNTRLGPDEQAALIVRLYRARGRLQGDLGYRMVRGSVGFFFHVTTGLRATGVENLPAGGFILATNHKSYADPPLLAAAVGGAIGFLAKAELFRAPLPGTILRWLMAIPIRRGRFDREALERTIAVLRQGRPVAVFPEGTRIPGPGLGPPRAGVGLLARHAGVCVVPGRIRGLESGFRLTGRRVRVFFGRPLEPEEGEEDAAFVARVMEAVARLGEPAGA